MQYKPNFKILCLGPIDEWQDPNLPVWPFTFDVAEFIQQPFKIILTLPHFSSMDELLSNHFSNLSESLGYDTSIDHNLIIEDIDLFLFYEYITEPARSTQHTIDWITNCKIKDYLLLQEHDKFYNDNVISRRYWITTSPFYNVYDKNFIESLRMKENKKYLFEALLGTPRLHRSFIMLNFLQNKNLLEKSLVSYRTDFNLDYSYNNKITKYNLESLESNTQRLKEMLFNDDNFIKYTHIIDHHYPYVSKDLESLDSNFDITSLRNNGGFPDEIYRTTWYSIISETSFIIPTLTEKLGKMFFTKRIFVVFGSYKLLKKLQAMGFKTFSNIIDEDYDNKITPFERWTMAFNEIQKLSEMDPEKVYAECEATLEHNYNRLFEYIRECRSEAHSKLLSKIPKEYLTEI